MENISFRCAHCGASAYANRSKRKCEKCRVAKLIDYVPKLTKAKACELYVMGATMKSVSEILKIPYTVVTQIIAKYQGIGEQPILMKVNYD